MPVLLSLLTLLNGVWAVVLCHNTLKLVEISVCLSFISSESKDLVVGIAVTGSHLVVRKV